MTPDTKILTKVEAAVASAGRVFFYSAATFLTGTIAADAWGGSRGVPDIQTLRAWGIGAAFAGGTALVAFVKNMAAPRSQVVK